VTGRRDRHFLAGIIASPRPFVLCVVRTSAPLAPATTLAADSRARRRGLLGRDRLAPGEALVIVPSQGIHTFGMRFSIDVVFVDRHGGVLTIAHAVPPRRFRFAWRAFAVVELAAGACHAAGLQAGDELAAEAAG
jgi:uncharacterized membrane protein (UPF0127 family)